VRALLAQADELGIDTESMREEVFYETETQSVQAYYKAFKSALEGAIARGREDSVQDTGEPSDAGAELTLTQPTVEEIVAKQDAAIKAEKDRKAAERAAEEKAKADEAAADFTLTGSDRDADIAASRGQKDIFAGEEAELETVETPDGDTLSYAAARGLVDKGYAVLALDDPRTYVDNSGKAQRTFEKDGVRLSLSPQIVLFQDKNRVLLARGNKEDLTLEVILVDSQDRGQGKASQALKDLVDVADKNGLVLYAEPTPIKDKKTNKAGLDFEQLVKLYKKVGFDFPVYYNGPSTKVM
jgi:GNAT superfamily N-acetyltransferase